MVRAWAQEDAVLGARATECFTCYLLHLLPDGRYDLVGK